MPTAIDIMDAIENNAYETTINHLHAAETSQDKQILKNILNSPTKLGISPFARAVHKLPQNPQQWGVVIVKMIIVGADVNAIYPNSYYSILHRLQLFAEDSFFKKLLFSLFENAFIQANMTLLGSVIAHNAQFIKTLRTQQKVEFYHFLMFQIHGITDDIQINNLSSDTTSYVNGQLTEPFQLSIEKIYSRLLDLINFLDPQYFHSTIDKRKWHHLTLALQSRALCIAQRILIDNEACNSFFKSIYIKGSLITTEIDQFFINTLLTIEHPRLIEEKYKINLSNNKTDQLKLLLSPLRLATLKLRQENSQDRSKISSSSNNTESKLNIINPEEILRIRKLLSLADPNNTLGINSLDDKALGQFNLLINAHHEQLKLDNIHNPLQRSQIQNMNDNYYRVLYETKLGKLPTEAPANNEDYRQLYIIRKNDYANLETMEEKFNYAVKFNLTICIKDLLEKTYFALEESWIRHAIFQAIAKKNSDLLTAIVEAKPFLIFCMANEEKRTAWDLLISQINTGDFQLFIIVMRILKNSFKIPGQTLLPLATAFGIIEIIDYLLTDQGKELENTSDIILSFQYAQKHHYYDIIVKLIQKEEHLKIIKNFIIIDTFSKSLLTGICDISDTEGLKYFFKLITVDLRKIFINNYLSISRFADNQDIHEELMTPEKWWRALIIQLKYRASTIQNSSSIECINADIFVHIDMLCRDLFPQDFFNSSSNENAIPPANPKVDKFHHRAENLLFTKYQFKKHGKNKLRVFLETIVNLMTINDIETLDKDLPEIYHSIDINIIANVSVAERKLLLNTIDDFISKIKRGNIQWTPALMVLIKIAVKLKCISTDNSKDILASLRYLLSPHEFNQIRHHLLQITAHVQFENQITIQEIIKIKENNIESTALDPKRKSNAPLNHPDNPKQKLTPNKFDLQMANAILLAKSISKCKPKWISPEKWKQLYFAMLSNTPVNIQLPNTYFNVYRKKMDDFKNQKPEKPFSYVVKLNMNKLLKNMLKEKSRHYREWNDDLKSAFQIALNNIMLAKCAKAFIEHIDPKDWEILVIHQENQLSILAIAEKNNNEIIQLAILHKIAAHGFYFNNYTIFHLAVIFKVPNTLRTCIVTNNKKLDDKNSQYPNQLTSFELAITQRFIEGIFCFIEESDNCFDYLRPQKLEELYSLYLQLINETNDINQFVKILNHLARMNQYHHTQAAKFTLNSVKTLALLNFAMMLAALRLHQTNLLPISSIISLNDGINLEHHMPTIENYFKTIKKSLVENSAKQNTVSSDQSSATAPIKSNEESKSNSEFRTTINTSHTIPSKSYPTFNEITQQLTSKNIIQVFIKAALNGNKVDIYNLFNLFVKDTNHNDFNFIDAYQVMIACAVELDFFVIFKEIVQCILDAILQSPPLINTLKPCLDYILTERRYKYLTYLINVTPGPQIYIDIVNPELFFQVMFDEIDSAMSVKELTEVYGKINGGYKLFLSSNDSTINKSAALIHHLKKRLVIVSETALNQQKEFESIKTILWINKDDSALFHNCILQMLDRCRVYNDFVYIDNQLQQWIQGVNKYPSLNAFHLILIIQTRIAIYKQMYTCFLNQPNNDIIVNNTALSVVQIPTNSSEHITFNNEKLHLIGKQKSEIAYSDKLPMAIYRDRSYRFYADLLDKNTYDLLDISETLLSKIQSTMEPLSLEQLKLFAPIVALLEKDTKISADYNETLNKLLPILIEYKTIVFILNSLKIPGHIKPIEIEFDQSYMTKEITQNSFSDLDRAIVDLGYPQISEESYHLILDNIIRLMSNDYTIHESNIDPLKIIWPNLLDRIEQILQSQVKNAIISKYTAEFIYIDEKSDDKQWLNLFIAQFGNPPINNTNALFYYQRLYKTTLLEFSYLITIQEQFDYCMQHQLIIKMHSIIESSASSLSYSQLQTTYMLAHKLNAKSTLILLLNSLSPFDILTLKDEKDVRIWLTINGFPDKEFISAASLILNNIKLNLLNSDINPIILCICFGMTRMALYLLDTTSPLSENDISSSFQTAIYYRNYQSVCALVDIYYEQHPHLFKINKTLFYNYLHDEISFCHTVEMINRFRAKLKDQYKLIRNHFQKPGIFQTKDSEWYEIFNKTDSRCKEIETTHNQTNLLTNHQEIQAKI